METLQNELSIRHVAFLIGTEKTLSIVGNFTSFYANAILTKRKHSIPRHRLRATAQGARIQIDTFGRLQVVSIVMVAGENRCGGVPAIVCVELFQTGFWINRQEFLLRVEDGNGQ